MRLCYLLVGVEVVDAVVKGGDAFYIIDGRFKGSIVFGVVKGEGLFVVGKFVVVIVVWVVVIHCSCLKGMVEVIFIFITVICMFFGQAAISIFTVAMLIIGRSHVTVYLIRSICV